MSVRLNFSKTFKTKVDFNLVLENGKNEAQSFEAEFNRLNRDQVNDIVTSGRKDADIVPDVLVGWSMKDADDKTEIPFNPETLAAFLSIPGAAGVTLLRYIETVGASKAKN